MNSVDHHLRLHRFCSKELVGGGWFGHYYYFTLIDAGFVASLLGGPVLATSEQRNSDAMKLSGINLLICNRLLCLLTKDMDHEHPEPTFLCFFQEGKTKDGRTSP